MSSNREERGGSRRSRFPEKENAASIASLLLTTEALITDLPEEKKDALPMPHGDMCWRGGR